MKSWQKIILIIILLTMPIMVFVSTNKKRSQQNIIDHVVLTSILPIQLVISTAFNELSDFWTNYVDLRYVRKENKLLQIKLQEQRMEHLLTREVIKENKRLRELLNYTNPPGFTHLTAQVIATGNSPFFHSVTINRGSRDGITPGSAAMVASGIVGRVVEVAPYSSEVSLITDPNSSFDILLENTRARGRIVGLDQDDTFQASLNYILRTEKVQLGDKVITSGLDGVFPKGLPVGYIIEIRKRLYGLHQDLVIAPAADFTKLEELLILIPDTPNTGNDDSSSDLESL